jgi:uncharacterized glyoxalase superfamily protein PhnB
LSLPGEGHDDRPMIGNRSVPPASITPVLTYPDVAGAVKWLTRAFAFVEHVRIGNHRVQLGFGDGAVIVADASFGRRAPAPTDEVTHSVMVRVSDVDEHYSRAKSAGAVVISAPADQSFGERQYVAADLAGHRWVFTQSIADLRPEDWGGTTVAPWQ